MHPTTQASKNKTNRGYISSTLSCHCPRCREGKLFTHGVSINLKKNMQMNKNCPVCGQPAEIEVGFYYGTSYVSYVITIGLSIISLLLWYLTIGLSVNDNRLFMWLILNSVALILLQPLLMRISRSLWLSWFVKYDRNWKDHQPADVSERMNKDQADNW